MDVHLYVYDLSQGLARTMSQQFLGIQIDAVYHTSLVCGGIEYFYGRGVQTCRAGSTHHGQPMEVIPMGRTDLPMEVILEYLDSLKEVYSAESYDLFLHNCNNFTNDFAMFLVGKGIPSHITSLPQRVLNTPFGQMLRPQLDAMMRPVTQAPVPAHAAARPVPARTPISASTPSEAKPSPPQPTEEGKVHNITLLSELNRLLDSARSRCAIIFFTSATCPPCKLVYQPYDDLAAEAGSKCVFIKVDFTSADRAIGARFPSVRATPTFITFLRGDKRDEWSGADPRKLKANVALLINEAFPSHPHLSKSVPILLQQSQKPILYTKTPPLDKLVAKMGDAGRDPSVDDIVRFLRTREREGEREATLPQLPGFAAWLRKSIETLPLELLFPALDLLRATLADARVAGFFAEEHTGASDAPATIALVLQHVETLGAEAPYALRLTALHVACNLFSSPLFTPHLLAPPLAQTLVSLVTTSLLGEKPALRASALSLALNVIVGNFKARMKVHERPGAAAAEQQQQQQQQQQHQSHLHPTELAEEQQVELLASLLEVLSPGEGSAAANGDGNVAVGNETSQSTKMALVCVGWLMYCAPLEGELMDLCKVMDARGTIGGVKVKGAEERLLVREVEGLC
ncbi:DUF862-domain-containing protein [Westerdykella ornata]|uniref:DUF862-domain-containing protein n=1 Tax=Westerdykella ornata TaxID=318751 RepID=A0A6A6JTM2_WESOR|nr:DUF862-domain-containing protein [Westerdykella ornata]KAF2279970.1 DUF862-domain-containing protein [Westerdykella ornata]